MTVPACDILAGYVSQENEKKEKGPAQTVNGESICEESIVPEKIRGGGNRPETRSSSPGQIG